MDNKPIVYIRCSRLNALHVIVIAKKIVPIILNLIKFNNLTIFTFIYDYPISLIIKAIPMSSSYNQSYYIFNIHNI